MKKTRLDPMGGRDKRPQLDEAAAFEEMKRERFGEKAHLATIKTTGSGISETKTISAPLLAFYEDHQDGCQNLEQAAPWSENPAMIEKLMGPILDRVRRCPGSKAEQCCHAEPGQSCFPNWREREDPEWYALQIHLRLGQVNNRISGEGKIVTALAADAGFELGSLFTEALIKFRWDKAAKVGGKVIEGGREAGEGRRKAKPNRLGSEETIAAVDAMLEQGIGKMEAYQRVADQQGVSLQTIRKEYRAMKN